ncbi:MAG: hypothetical protein R2813_04755 [Flavobacteriales bacterium]
MKQLIRTLVLFMFIFTLGLDGMAVLKVKFRILDDAQNVMKGMTIRLYDKNDIIEEIQKAGPSISFELQEETIYTIEVELQGFVTKRVMVVTDLLGDVEDVYRFEIRLERQVDYRGIRNADDFFEYPSAIIEMDTNSGVFNYNETYLLSTQKAIRELYESGREIKF